MPPASAPGLSFALTLRLKNPQLAVEPPVVSSLVLPSVGDSTTFTSAQEDVRYCFRKFQDLSLIPMQVSSRKFSGTFTCTSYASTNRGVSFRFRDSPSDFDGASSNQRSDPEKLADELEKFKIEHEPMDEDYFEPMIQRVEREETRGDTFINCRTCGNTFDYGSKTLWVPGYQRTLPPSLQMTNEYTHPQIVRCPACDNENCMACEKSPHDECCSFSYARTVWHALCSVDDAIIQHRKVSPSDMAAGKKNLDAVILKALNILLEYIPNDTTSSFTYCDLLRKSLLLDQMAVIISNMTIENQFDSVCLQSWGLMHVLSKRFDLFGLLFEDRLQYLRNMSPGIRVLGFPIAFFSVERIFDADQYAPETYTIWSLIQNTCQNAHQFLSEQAVIHDEWPVVMLARSVIYLHDTLKKEKNKPLPELISFMQGQQLNSFAARLEDMHRVEGTKYGAVHANTRASRLAFVVKKRGREDQVECEENAGEKVRGKRSRTT